MATTKPARSPRRIRRWLQTTAVGTVLVSSSLFGLIAVQGANAAHDAGAAVPSATPWVWPSDRGAAVATAGTPLAAATATPIATRTVEPVSAPAPATTVVATSTAVATSTPAASATPTVRTRTRAS